MSLQDTYRGRPGSALSLAQTAVEISRGSATPLAATMLATRLARAHARQQEAPASERALDEARRSFAQAGRDEEPTWVSYVDAVELAAQAGACYLDLGRAGEAMDALTTALGLLETAGGHRVRDRVHYLSRLAKCHLLERDVEQACAVATEALSISTGIGTARVIERIEEFNAALAPYADVPASREFRERFAELR